MSAGEDSNQSWNPESGTSSPFKEILNEGRSGAEEDSMSTPNMSSMSFDSPIVVTKTPTTDADGDVKKSTEESGVPQAELADAEEDQSKAKKPDMFAPEADMFAEEYSVSCLFFLVFCFTPSSLVSSLVASLVKSWQTVLCLATSFQTIRLSLKCLGTDRAGSTVNARLQFSVPLTFDFSASVAPLLTLSGPKSDASSCVVFSGSLRTRRGDRFRSAGAWTFCSLWWALGRFDGSVWWPGGADTSAPINQRSIALQSADRES